MPRSVVGRDVEFAGLAASVGEGRTNAEIAQRLGLSRHTVVSQLTSAATKLGPPGAPMPRPSPTSDLMSRRITGT